jgi:hypothetical protein
MFSRRILALAATLLTALTIAGATTGAAGPSHSDAALHWCVTTTCTAP